MTAPTTPAGMPELPSKWGELEKRLITIYGLACYEAGRTAAREAALEEAARVCERLENNNDDGHGGYGATGEDCYVAIRALKGKP